ncbi:protein artichoke [Bacillus rossius redtenbacheri]|uniref:protein artichoke n=1 Tax=Bacillus rossius redtenbacheri TaxID=93214 RepID=UPI002FDE4A0A
MAESSPRVMSTFLYTLLGLTVGSSLHCPERREISPCSCRVQEHYSDTTAVVCERMASFGAVAEALRGKFSPDADIALRVSHSRLADLDNHTFQGLGFLVSTLKLNNDDLSVLEESVFAGLGRLQFLSLADNQLGAVPRHVLRQTPHVKTLDLSRSQLQRVAAEDFQDIPELHSLILGTNDISELEQKSLPRTLRHLHLARNKLSDLNYTLRELSSLEWLFINENQLRSLDGQLPAGEAAGLKLLHAANNQLQRLPPELRGLARLESLFVHCNELGELGGALQRLRALKRLHLHSNAIAELSPDDFLELESLEDLQLQNNRLRALNGSLLPLRALRYLNLSRNQLPEFSLQEIRGLNSIRVLDLSYNSISQLGGQMENLVEAETRVLDLRLEHNNLRSLAGSLMGLQGLRKLSLSHNGLQAISPDDLIGLDDLRFLDVSNNHLSTLEETSKTFLPSLERLIASNNFLTTLDKDFHGLPALCYADLSNNLIEVVGRELASAPHCRLLGVAGTLRVELQGNPIFCTPDLASTMRAMNNTKLLGVTCPVAEVVSVE